MGEAKIFCTMAKLSPAFGVVGPLISLAIMMQGLGSADTETLYGVLLSNQIFFSIAVKVDQRIEE